MRSKIAILTATLLCFLGSAYGQYCTNDSRYTEASFFDSTQITIGTNIQYGIAPDFQGNPDTLLMDLYYPNLAIDLSPKRPFVMLIHGGGFSTGNKQAGDIKDLCVYLALRGFVCASINYRLGHDFSEYGQYKARYRAIQDGNAATRFIVNNANAVRIDTSWLFVGGQSAGALTALGMVYADQFELDSISLLYSATATSVELGNLHTSGNTLTNRYSLKGVFNNWGGVVESEIDRDEMKPTIAFHGERDTVVPINSDSSFAYYTLSGSRTLHDDLIANGICTELTVDANGGHGIYRNASAAFRAQRAACFFKRLFCNTCTSLYTTDSIPSNCSTPLLSKVNDFGSAITIFPNPFESAMSIAGVDGVLELTMYNCFGKVVHQSETSDGVARIDVRPGIYYLQVKQLSSNKTFTSKVVKH